MNEVIVEQLAHEVSDLLDAGDVGLYEFIWILRSDQPDLAEREYRGYAQAALQRLLAVKEARLVWKRWADVDYEMDASDVTIDDAAWNDPTDDPYLAVVPVGSGRG